MLYSKVNKAPKSMIIRMAWEEDVTFSDMQIRLGLNRKDVTELMRLELKPMQFKMWSHCVAGRKTAEHRDFRVRQIIFREFSSYNNALEELRS